MPSFTPNFDIEYFNSQDVISASVDRSRFLAIDSYLAFISDVIGDGVIEGWNITVSASLTLRVDAGWGMVNGRIIKTYGNYEKNLVDNRTYYVWMRNRKGIIAEISGVSNLVRYVHVDSAPPSPPSNFTVTTISSSEISLAWAANENVTIIRYEVYRSINNIQYTLVAETTDLLYVDRDLAEDSIFYYKIRILDDNKTYSAYTESKIGVTSKDFTIPNSVANFLITVSDKILHLNWDRSLSPIVQKYAIEYFAVDIEKRAIENTTTLYVDRMQENLSITNLRNDLLYYVSIYAISKNNVASEKIIFYSTPRFDLGPDDVYSLEVSEFAASNSLANVLDLSWLTYDDPYLNYDGQSEIILEEYRSDAIVTTSDPIVVGSGINFKTVQNFQYSTNGRKYLKAVSPRTTYYVTVRNFDELNSRSVGKRVRYVTKNFIPPNAPTALRFQLIPSSEVIRNISYEILISWYNSASVFTDNIITITRSNLQNEEVTTIIEERYIGSVNSYLLTSDLILNGSIYTVTVRCVDEYDNFSASVTDSFTLAIPISDRPSPPDFYVMSGDKQVLIAWYNNTGKKLTYVRVYRASYPDPGSASNPFVLIETIPYDNNQFIDYGVENDNFYSYFLAGIDELGIESRNKFNNPSHPQTFVVTKPTARMTIPAATNLVATADNMNIDLVWQATGGLFDGYEILRSQDNLYSFQSIASLPASQTYYTDDKILNRNKILYYLVRKFRNEAEPYIIESPITVNDATLIGIVKVKDGEATIDQDVARNIKNLQDPIIVETNKQIDAHKHDYYSATRDRRINLHEKQEIIEWFTYDNKSFFTPSDLKNVTAHELFIGGYKASETGLLYVFNKENSTLVFERKLAPQPNEIESATYPYATLPSLDLRVEGLEEVQNILDANRVDGLSARQVESGVFYKKQITKLHHQGRINEPLIPQQFELATIDDGYRFAFIDDTQFFGSATIFYDIIAYNDDYNLLAATSAGILRSLNFGQTWQVITQLTSPVSKFLYAQKYDAIFAATNTGIFVGNLGTTTPLQTWVEVRGCENAKIIRDIIIDQDGDVYCSTDLGVFKLRQVINQEEFYMQQMPILGTVSSEGYAMLYDNTSERLLVSNEIGMFESYNKGENWFYTDEFPEQNPINSLLIHDQVIYALTDFNIYRKSKADVYFTRVAVLEDCKIARKIIVFKQRLYVTTDIGLLVSDAQTNIANASIIRFELAFNNMRMRDAVLPCTSLNIIDNKVYIGTEAKTYIYSFDGEFALQYTEENVVVPTVFVDGIEQAIGYRHSSTTDGYRKFLCFDRKLEHDAVVTVANQYKVYEALYGGWVDCNYIAPITLKVDGITANRICVVERPASALTNIQYPSVNTRNCNLATHNAAFTKLQNSIQTLVASEATESGEFVRFIDFSTAAVTKVYNNFEYLRSQMYKSARFVTVTDASGVSRKIDFEFPRMNVLLIADASDGVQKLSLSQTGSFGLYKDVTNLITTEADGNFGSELVDNKLPDALIDSTIGCGKNIAIVIDDANQSAFGGSQVPNSDFGDLIKPSDNFGTGGSTGSSTGGTSSGAGGSNTGGAGSGGVDTGGTTNPRRLISGIGS